MLAVVSAAACGGAPAGSSPTLSTNETSAPVDTSTGASTPTTSTSAVATAVPGGFAADAVDSGGGTTMLVTPGAAASLTAIVASGVTATLDLPAGAVTDDVQVTLRPITAGGLIGMAIEPEGLFLVAPAVLQFDGTTADVYVRAGWADTGAEHFVPTWRSADRSVAMLRLRPVVLALPVTALSPPANAATTTTALASAPPVDVPSPGDRPELDWVTDILPRLADAESDDSSASDLAAWALERAADEDDDPEVEQLDAISEAGTARGRVLVQRCADREAPRLTAEELSDLIDGDAVRIKDAKEVAGCLVLAWRVTETVRGHLDAGSETIELDEVQTATTATMIDAGSSTSTAPIYGRTNGQGGIMSMGFSMLGAAAGEYAGVETPPISSTYCTPMPDQQSGTMTLQTDPLPDDQIRLTVTVTPGLFDVGCGPEYLLPPFGWAMVSALRGEEPGTPMVMTLPIAPQTSRSLGFTQQVSDSRIRTTADGSVQVTIDGLVIDVMFTVSLAFAPAP